MVGKGVVDRVYPAPLYARLNRPRRTFHGQRSNRVKLTHPIVGIASLLDFLRDIFVSRPSIVFRAGGKTGTGGDTGFNAKTPLYVR